MRNFYSSLIWGFILGILFFIIAFFHLWQLENLPRGLYVDESSIGYNAALISKTGDDEHGKHMPIFFEAFGEYKNPLYIYSAALLFKILDISVFNLRIASFLFFFLFLIGICFLTWDLFKNKFVIVFTLLSAGFLPWFFNLSRIAFEAISQITVIVFFLIFIRRGFHSRDNRILNPFAAGLFLGLSLYTYSTARLLTFLLLISVFVIYHSYIKKLLIMMGAFVITILPYIYFSISNPGALTYRFHLVTYLYDKNLTSGEKLETFLGNYLNYLSPNYLLFKGDTSLRHHTGASGELYLIVFALALVFFLYKLKRKFRADSFQLLLLMNFTFAPVAAALTTGDSSLRSIFIGLYILIFSFYGLSFLIENISGFKRLFLLFCVFSLLSFEMARYIGDYFSHYPNISIRAFEGYGIDKAINLAYEKQPKKIIISNTLDQTGIHYKFYSQINTQKGKVPVIISKPLYSQNACFVFPIQDKKYFDSSPFALKFTAENGVYYNIRCY